jgi:tRNA-modifying protein YgfZ
MSQPLPAVALDLEREYSAGREGAALVTLARGTLDVSGPKRQDFLHSMLSNEVKSLAPGSGCRAASMTAKGSLQALLRVLVDKSVVVLETEQDRLEPVLRTLEFHKVGAPVRFATGKTAVLAVLGPRAGEALERAGATTLPEADEAHVEVELGGTKLRLVRASDLPGAGFVLHAPLDAVDAVAGALRGAGAEPIGRETTDALRVEALCPWYGTDIDEHNLLHETGLLGAVHSSTKGCYVGQEVIARLEGRGGNVNKALRGLRLTAPAAAGDPVTAAGKNVGYVTTAAVSPRLGFVALGYVHRSHFAPGSAVEVAGAPATVVGSFEERA